MNNSSNSVDTDNQSTFSDITISENGRKQSIVKEPNSNGRTTTNGRINLVDLAGSERVRDFLLLYLYPFCVFLTTVFLLLFCGCILLQVKVSGVVGKELEEAKQINRVSGSGVSGSVCQ